ncbi:MAG: CHAT domain-containing protein [Deltaproteobacteria bacterium]|nr:CHAT domain-containing protein [Deltaproteobacteria bacterium]
MTRLILTTISLVLLLAGCGTPAADLQHTGRQQKADRVLPRPVFLPRAGFWRHALYGTPPQVSSQSILQPTADMADLVMLVEQYPPFGVQTDQMLQAALNSAVQRNDKAQQAWLHLTRGYVAYRTGDNLAAKVHASRALEMAFELNHAALAMRSLSLVSLVDLPPVRQLPLVVSAGTDISEELLRDIFPAGRSSDSGKIESTLLSIRYRQLSSRLQGIELAPDGMLWVKLVDGYQYYAGRQEEKARQVWQELERAAQTDQLVGAMAALGQAHLEIKAQLSDNGEKKAQNQNAAKRAADALNRADKGFKAADYSAGRGQVLLLSAQLAYLRGKPTAAQRQLAKAREIFDRIGLTQGALDAYFIEAAADFRAGNISRAETAVSNALSARDPARPGFLEPLPQNRLQQLFEHVAQNPRLKDREDPRPLDQRLSSARRFYRWAGETGDPLAITLALGVLIDVMRAGSYTDDVVYYEAMRETVYRTYRAAVPLKYRLLRSALVDYELLRQSDKSPRIIARRFGFKLDQLVGIIEGSLRAQGEIAGGMTDLGLTPEEIEAEIKRSVAQLRRWLKLADAALNSFHDALERGDRPAAARHFADFSRNLQYISIYRNAGTALKTSESSGTQSVERNFEGKNYNGNIEYRLKSTYILETRELTAVEMLHDRVAADFRRDILMAGLLGERKRIDQSVNSLVSFYELYREELNPPAGIDLPSLFDYDKSFDPDEQLENPEGTAEREKKLDAAVQGHQKRYLSDLIAGIWQWYPPDSFGSDPDLWYLDRNYRIGKDSITVLHDHHEITPGTPGGRDSLYIDHAFKAEFILRDESPLLNVPQAERQPDIQRQIIDLKGLTDPYVISAPGGNFEKTIEGFLAAGYRDTTLLNLLQADVKKLSAIGSVFHRYLLPGQIALSAGSRADLVLLTPTADFAHLAVILREQPRLKQMLVQLADFRLTALTSEPTQDIQDEQQLQQQVKTSLLQLAKFLNPERLPSTDSEDPFEAVMGMIQPGASTAMALGYPELLYTLIADTPKTEMMASGLLARHHKLQQRLQKATATRKDLTKLQETRFELALHFILSRQYDRAMTELDALVAPGVKPEDAFQFHFLAAVCAGRLGRPALQQQHLDHSIAYLDRVRTGLRTRQLAAALGPVRRIVYEHYLGLLYKRRDFRALADLVARYKVPAAIPAVVLANTTERPTASQLRLNDTILLFNVLSRDEVWQPSGWWQFFDELVMELIDQKQWKAPGPRKYQTRPVMLAALNSIGGILANEIAGAPDTSPEARLLMPVLRPEELLVSYFAGTYGIYGVVVDSRKNTTAFYRSLPIEQLIGMANSLREAIQDGREIGPKAAALYEILLTDIATLDKSSRLAIWPDGPLSSLPFQVLKPAAQSPFLIQSHVITYVAGSYATATAQPAGGIPNTVVIVANPDGSLPESEDEARTIAALEKFKRAEVLIGREAGLSNFAAHLPAAGFVHLATHARFNKNYPNFSYLQFAGGDRLYSLDLGRLAFAGKNVFLSACETYVGHYLPGDDPYGLVNAFVASGASSLVATLWRVESASAALFAKQYYRYLQNTADPALSLAKTARNFIEQRIWLDAGAVLLNDPLYWAGFNYLVPLAR